MLREEIVHSVLKKFENKFLPQHKLPGKELPLFIPGLCVLFYQKKTKNGFISPQKWLSQRGSTATDFSCYKSFPQDILARASLLVKN
jgi:hypothetical protein